MKHIYIDDSIHDRGNFIICGVVIADRNPDALIGKSLANNGFNPDSEEFKSGISYRKYPSMSEVRSDMKSIINGFCKFALVIIPRDERENIGYETLIGLKQFIKENKIEEPIEVSIDEGFFKSIQQGTDCINEVEFKNCHFNLEQDSIKTKGIQLADLIAHTASIMLLESMGLVSKKVKAGENSGYDPDMDIEIGFELWATFRYSFLSEPKKEIKDDFDEATYDVLPYGLYISKKCDTNLTKSALKRFSEVYLGCIH